MSLKIAFVHHKGGTGKTTACLNIAGWLVKMEKKVLVVDLDPQGNATTGLGIERKSIDYSIYDVLFGEKKLTDIILESSSGVHIVPSSLDLLAAETHMAGMPDQMTILKNHLGGIEKYYDYILIDVPPGSTILMINGIVAAENIIVPLDSGVFAYETLDTLKTLIIDINEELKTQTNVLMVLLREYSTNLLDKFLTYEVKGFLKKFLKTNLTADVKTSIIPFSRKIYMAQKNGMPISHFAPFSNVGRAYKRIAKEIENNS